MANKMEQFIKELKADEKLRKVFVDPVLFSVAILGITPRWYQAKMMRDDAQKKVARLGRRSGKTFAMILYILWYAFTNPDKKTLVIGPFGIQVDTIFDELRSIINKVPLLRASVTRSVQSPQRIEFGNGHVVMGLSAGSSSGRGGSSIRGQGSDLIIIDESDYLTKADLNSIMGMQLEDMGNIKLWISSTPTGMRKMFWNWCVNASTTYEITNKKAYLNADNPVDVETKKTRPQDGNGWTEYHYPSWVSPNWDSEMETELRAMFSAQGYIHEVLAEFGDETTGVYQKEAIDRSKYDYKYEQIKEQQNNDKNTDRIRIIGVDWDKYSAATQIVVSEYNDEERKIRVVDRVEIPSTEFTFDKAVNKIIKLNTFWKPAKLYLDRGYGEYQVEMLKKKIGKDKVVGIAFNQNIEVVDPTDRTVDKKMVKHFMITQTQILLERNQLMFSKYDDVLYKQMENYQVVRKTTSGKPVYTSENEHSHDAFVLTILGFNQEFPEITKLLEKRRKATIMGVVRKRLNEAKDSLTFGQTFERSTSKKKSNEEDLKDEPHYVRHMKSIRYGPMKSSGGSLSRRGENKAPVSRRGF